MSLTFESIPDHAKAPPGAARSTALERLEVRPERRTVLKAIAFGALTIGAAMLDWPGIIRARTFGARTAWAESGPNGLQGWDRNDCHDAYPAGYQEEADTNGLYKNTYAACFGGTWRGSDYCDAGWHKYGTYYVGDVQVDHVPISTACGAITTKNSWRWTTPDGHVYRCSDGYSTFWGGPQNGNTYLTICRA